jgi:hypothetical protein
MPIIWKLFKLVIIKTQNANYMEIIQIGNNKNTMRIIKMKVICFFISKVLSFEYTEI